MRTTRQLRAMSLLVWRFGTRLAFRGGTPQVGLRAAATRLMLVALFVTNVTFNLGRQAYEIGHLPRGRLVPTTAFMDALFFFALAMAAAIELGPTLRRRSGTLGDPGMLDPLPLFFGTRIGLLLAQSALFLAAAIPSTLCLAGSRSPEEWPALFAVTTAFALASLFLSALLCQAMRVALSAHRARTGLQILAWVSTLSALAFMLASFPTRSEWVRAVRFDLASSFSLFDPVTELIASRPGSSYGRASLWLGLMGGLALAALWLFDRLGFDRVLTASPQLQEKSAARMDANRVERVLLRREQRVIVTWITDAGGFAFSIFLSARFLHSDQVSSAAHATALFLPYLVAEFGFIYAWTHSIAQAGRDLRARPFLASLPLTPATTLASKEAALWWAVLPVLSWLVPPLVATHGNVDLLWKSGIAAAGVVLVCLATPAMAFLSQGIGSATAVGAGARLEGLLIAIPLFGALAAPTPLTELPSLAALALLAFEAKRAAALRVRWLDDAGDELERETPVWRALLVFAFFAGLQGLVGLAFSWTTSGIAIGIAYLVAAAALILLTLNGRQGLTRLAWQGTRPWLMLVGAGLGALAGFLAARYGRLIERFGLDSGPLTDAYQSASPAVRVGLAATAILAAPLAEEMFFRGWLQPAIKVELPAGWKRFAFVLSAFAFASIHPGLAFPVVFLLGLVAGLLYELTGGILAGICAHAAYNAVVTLVGG